MKRYCKVATTVNNFIILTIANYPVPSVSFLPGFLPPPPPPPHQVCQVSTHWPLFWDFVTLSVIVKLASFDCNYRKLSVCCFLMQIYKCLPLLTDSEGA